ncbi:MAG: NAD(P)H-dependent oxidoreductase subunit E [Anaerolineales bacterium]|nr:NAD(P)H-dependent oxidoreductase subunit E [Anaerolineales bacterium]MCB9128749.1 NAD(P)H-dependent oxidoreductase subunit E [Ardenticatenales bacterium]
MLQADRPERVAEILSRYPEKRAALMPMLYEAQDVYGYLTEAAIHEVAAILALDPTEVSSVSEFYSLYYHKPVGRYVIRFCTDMPCALVGAESAYDELLDILGLEDGGTTEDGLFTVEQAVCLAACGVAPVLQVNLRFFATMTRAKMEALIDTIRAGGLPEDHPVELNTTRTADTVTGLA